MEAEEGPETREREREAILLDTGTCISIGLQSIWGKVEAFLRAKKELLGSMVHSNASLGVFLNVLLHEVADVLG